MNRAIGVSACLLLLMIGSTVEAQIVRVGPFGGVRIRAPFFSMNVPAPPVSPYFVPPIPPSPVVVHRYGYPYPAVQIEYPAPVVVESTPADSLQTARRPNWTPPVEMAELEVQLRDAASRLVRSLSVRRGGEIWMDYLAPERIVSAIEQGDRASLAGLTRHYDGVAGNPQLAWLVNLEGFAATRSLLHQYVSAPSENQAAAEQPRAVEPSQRAASDAADPVPAEPQPVELPELLPEPTPDPVPSGEPPEKNVPTPAAPIKAADTPAALRVLRTIGS